LLLVVIVSCKRLIGLRVAPADRRGRLASATLEHDSPHGPEEHKVKIGILGAGNIGGNLVRRLRALGHHVSVANSRGPETLSDLSAETGAKAVPASEVARGADVVVVTIPQNRIPDFPAGILDGAADGTVVIDTGNYYPQQRDGRIDGIESGLTESRWVERQLGHPVVKAFNNIYASHLLEGGRPPVRRAGSLFPWPATTKPPRPRSCASSMSWASTRWTPEGSTTRGVSNRELLSTARTSTSTACVAASAKPAPNAPRSGAPDGERCCEQSWR
jgi:predicted dinucleotide-binding enzyme